MVVEQRKGDCDRKPNDVDERASTRERGVEPPLLVYEAALAPVRLEVVYTADLLALERNEDAVANTAGMRRAREVEGGGGREREK